MSRWSKGTLDHDGDGKMGGSLKESAMTKPKTAKPAAPKKAPTKSAAPRKVGASAAAAGRSDDADEQRAFDQGRRARLVAIGSDQSPFAKDDKLRAHWDKGWAYQDEVMGSNAQVYEAAAARGLGQAGTVSAPKKG